VRRFAKLPPAFGFSITYTDAAANLRYYEPDFVAVTDDAHYLFETKGREDLDVSHKDKAAGAWCARATELTGTAWRYLKVPQKEFEQLQPEAVDELAVLMPVTFGGRTSS